MTARPAGHPKVREPFVVRFPWPVRAAWQNGTHGHWATLARAVKRQRRDAHLIALGARPPAYGPSERLSVALKGHPTRRGRVDAQNLLGAMKGALDGLADALGADDSRFDVSCTIADPVPGGEVVVTVEAAE